MNLSVYRRLFADRPLRRIMLSTVLPRLPLGMNALSLTMMVQEQSGSFGHAGWVTGAYMAAVAVQAPLVGRTIDLRGPQRILLPLTVGYVLAMLLLVWVTQQQAALPWLMGMAALAGLCFPPVSTVLRAALHKSAMPPALRQSAFAVDMILVESSFVLGPMLLSLMLLLGTAAHAVLLSAAFMGVGVPLFVRSGALQRWGEVQADAPRHWLGPLREVGVRRTLGFTLLATFSLGLLEMSIPAFAHAHGQPQMVGPLYALMSVPSITAVLVYGTRTWRWPLTRQLLLCALWLAAGYLLMAQAGSITWFALGCALTGIAIGPLFTVMSLQLGAVAPTSTVTEAFTWFSTLVTTGLGGGMWLGGLLVQQADWTMPLLTAIAAATVAALWSLWIPRPVDNTDAPLHS
ncbi:MAG: MFS transporter [Lautropia sp.]|nr:MFS transporter [Lautropia sp.]